MTRHDEKARTIAGHAMATVRNQTDSQKMNRRIQNTNLK